MVCYVMRVRYCGRPARYLFCFVLAKNTHAQHRRLVSDAKRYLPACDDGCNIFLSRLRWGRARRPWFVDRLAIGHRRHSLLVVVVGADVVAWPNASGRVLAIHLPVATGIILWDRW